MAQTNRDKLPIVTKFNKTYLSIKDENGSVRNRAIQIYAISGSGKGLLIEMLIEAFHDAGYVVLIIADPKRKAELSFAGYLPQSPEENYHLNKLRLLGMVPEKKEIKLYHPQTFSIKKGLLPNINFFTIPIKSLLDEEFSILTETSGNSESIKIMKRARDNISKDDGLYAFLHEIRRMIRGKRKGRHLEPDPKNFLLDSSSATGKSMVETSGIFGNFTTDYFLRKESDYYKLDWESIINDQKPYHVFLSMWISDPKVRGFLILSHLKHIIETAIHHAKKPILVVIPEILELCSRKNEEGYSKFLSKEISKALVTMRSQGVGMSSLCDSQNWDLTSEEVKGSGMVTFFGQLNPQDLDRICKARGYNKDNRERIMSLKVNQFVMANAEEDGAWDFFLSRHCHAEESYNWIESYKQNYPEKMKRYDDLIAYMKKELADEENKIKKEIESRRRQERLEREREEKELEEKSTKGIKLTHEIKKAKGKQDEAKDIIKKTMYEYLDNPNISDKEKTQRKLSDKFKVGRFVINKWIEERNKPETLSEEELEPMIGEGILDEEVDNSEDKILED